MASRLLASILISALMASEALAQVQFNRDLTRIIQVGGVDRVYDAVWRGTGCAHSLDLIVALHGGGAAFDMSDLDSRVYMGLEPLAYANCIAVLYPRATDPGPQWNFAPEFLSGTDDQAFVNAAVDDFVAYAMALYGDAVSTARASLVGLSGGAALALNMACAGNTARFRQVHAVAAVMTETQYSRNCAGGALHSHTKVVHIVHGTGDDVVPFQGSAHWPGLEGSIAIQPAVYGAGNVRDLFTSMAGGYAGDYFITGMYPDGTAGIHYVDRNYMHGATPMVIYSMGVGPCTGGGYKSGACDYFERGLGHRWPGSPCAVGGCGGLGGPGSGRYSLFLDMPLVIQQFITAWYGENE